MPKMIRKEFRANGVRAHIRKRIRGNSVSYEVRCRCNGYNVSASGLTVEEAKAHFIQKLNDIAQGGGAVAPSVPTSFEGFALYYFEKFRRRKVADITYRNDYKRLKVHILPHFGNVRIKDVTPQMCQMLIDKLEEEGKGKTAEEVFSLLNCTFKAAIKHNIIVHNPLDIVLHGKHDRQHGKALTVEEEKRLLSESADPFRTWFAIGLYTGLRPNEYATARIVGNMLYARNSKRHNGKEETKRIPLSPMLRRHVSETTPLDPVPVSALRSRITKIFGGTHKLYDLRTTFYTRCQTCGVSAAARDEFVGHSGGELQNTYTDLPDDYLIKEAEKLDY